ncbi:MAG: hypothetical protein QXH20_02200 [Candidatus Bathyarchaeia archaeon]
MGKTVSFGTKSIIVKIPPELDERLDKICQLCGTKKHFLILRAIEEGVEKIETRLAQLWVKNDDQEV